MVKRIPFLLVVLLSFCMVFIPQKHTEASMKNYEAIAVGQDHFLAIDCDGAVWAWGRNTFGQLGYNHAGGLHVDTNNPQLVRKKNGAMVKDIVAVSAGVGHSVALDSEGKVWTWGLNSSNQLGRDTSLHPPDDPTAVSFDPDVNVTIVAIAAGPYYTLALDSEGDVWAWGDTTNGELRSFNNAVRETPVKITLGSSIEKQVIAIAAGGEHTVFLVNDGTVKTLGKGTFGQLGNGQTEHAYDEFQSVTSINDAVAIAAGGHHTLVLRRDTTVWGFGLNEYGQIGDVAHFQFNTPVQVPNFKDVMSIQAGDYHSVALKNDGTSWVWGRNNAQSMAHRATPVLIENMTNGLMIATGGSAEEMYGEKGPHILSVKEDGSLWAWDMSTIDPTTKRPKYSRVLGLDCVSISSPYPYIQGDTVLFRYQGPGNNVEVSGDFNDSFIPIPMVKISEGVWELRLKIPPGEYRYGFRVDGRWQLDQMNRQHERTNEGNFNRLKILPYEGISPKVEGRKVTFIYNSLDNPARNQFEFDAKTKRVAVYGEFTRYNYVELERQPNNTWAVTMEIEPGSYSYHFVLEDGKASSQERIYDPLNTARSSNPITGEIQNKLNVPSHSSIVVPVQSVTFTPSTPMNLVVGEEEQLYYDIQPQEALNQQVRWSSSNPNIVSVNAQGMITANSGGTAVVTVTTVDGEFTAFKTITVRGAQSNFDFPRENYRDLGVRQAIATDHTWRISFSTEVNRQSVNDTNIYVLDSYGQRVDVLPRVSDQDSKVIELRRLDGFTYQNGELYYIVVEGDVRDRYDRPLSEPVMLTFVTRF